MLVVCSREGNRRTIQGLPIVFGTADDFVSSGFNDFGTDHHMTLDKVLRICREANLKLNKEKCHF